MTAQPSPSFGDDAFLAWQIASQAILDDLTDPAVTHVTSAMVDWLERAITSASARVAWVQYRRRVVQADPEADDEYLRDILTLKVKGTPLWCDLLEHGFQATLTPGVQSRRESRPQLLRVVAAVIHHPDLLEQFVQELATRRPAVPWVERARVAAARLAKNKRPVK